MGKILKVFITVISHDSLAAMSLTDQIRLTFLVGDYPRYIPVKFGQNRPSGIGGDVIKTKLLMMNPVDE